MARELSTSLRAHFELSHHERDNDGNCQAIGKVMHHTLSMAGKLYDCYKSSGKESVDLEAIRAIQPILAVAKLELERVEKYINRQRRCIHNDSNEGRGQTNEDRFECASCYAELWGYYVQALANETKQEECVCFQCYMGARSIFGGRGKFWRRTQQFTFDYISEMFEMFEELLNNDNEGDRIWWESTISRNLIKEYERTHSHTFGLKPTKSAGSRKRKSS